MVKQIRCGGMTDKKKMRKRVRENETEERKRSAERDGPQTEKGSFL